MENSHHMAAPENRDIIRIGDRNFVPYIGRDKIHAAVCRVAARISADLAGTNPLFVCVLNGAFVFAADLFREISIGGEITFVRMKSYDGTQSTGRVREIHGLDEDIAGRTVVIVEDIVDTGYTVRHLREQLLAKGPQEVRVAALLFKPEALKCEVTVDYAALEIPNRFIVGYGLDYNEQGRQLKDIYVVKE